MRVNNICFHGHVRNLSKNYLQKPHLSCSFEQQPILSNIQSTKSIMNESTAGVLVFTSFIHGFVYHPTDMSNRHAGRVHFIMVMSKYFIVKYDKKS